MLINNPEALKSWLVIVLEPLCDADSSALARYVLALLKKDKPEKELMRVMIEQLDVFLGEETKLFVERLFNAISSEEYLQTPAIVTPLISSADDEVNAVEPATAEDAAISKEEATTNSTEAKIMTTETTTSSSHSATTAAVSSLATDQVPAPSSNETKEANNSSSSNDSAAMDVANRSSSQKTDAPNSSYSSTSGHLVRSASPPGRSTGIIAIADKENQPRESRRRRASLRSRSRSPRSRSRSNERLSRRSRSRERRINEREKNQRQFRNKSPPPFDSRHERRRGGGGGGLDRRRIGGGATVGGGGAADERSPRFGSGGADRKGRQNRSNSRSRSPSLERINTRNKGSPARGGRGNGNSPDRHSLHHSSHVPPPPPSLQQQHEGEKRQRCRDFDEKGYCVRGETCPWDHGVNPVVFEGINNSALISMSLREYNPDAPDLWSRSTTTGGLGAAPTAGGGINPFTGVARPGVGPGGIIGPAGFPLDKNTNGALAAAEYARAAGVAGAGGFRTSAGAPMLPFPFNPAAVATPLQRELIPIPVVDASGGTCATGGGLGGDVSAVMQHVAAGGGKRRFELEDSVAIADGPAATTKRKPPLNSRLGPRMMGPNMQSNCSLELRKVPRGLNSIAHLNNHFAKFGKIVNIQISYDGDPEAAIVTFSTHAEANVAYRSTEAVLNNRFIKVFWHTGALSQDIAEGGVGGAGMSSGGRKNSQYHLNNVPAVPTPTADSAKTANISTSTSQTVNTPTTTAAGTTTTPTGGETTVAATHVAPPSLRLKNNMPPRGAAGAATNATIIRKKQEQAKAVVQLANGLRKRKQELLQSYLKQMKSALELVERCEASDPQRAKTLDTIKVLQETIDKLRKEIAAEQEQIQVQIQNQQQQLATPPPPKKTKEQQKKELLDIELELFAQQQEGNDTTAIQKRLEELQRSLGIVPGSASAGVIGSNGGPPGGGKAPHFAGGKPRAPRATFHDGSTRVDRRPKTIVVTGFTSEEAEFVLGHFKHFGEITKHDVDKEIPQLILSYATRINAEQAVVRGKFFKDKRLQISWAPVIQPPTALVAPNPKAMEAEDSNADVTKVQGCAIAAAALTSPIVEKNRISESSEAGITSANDTLPELRLEDEEEDEESEDRSWRR